MNKIYKVIWSKTRNCYVAVAEFVKRNGKGGSVLNRRHIAAALAAVAICAAPAGVLAANTGGHWDGDDYIGYAPYKVTINEQVNGIAYGRYETGAGGSSGATLSIVTGGKANVAFGGRAARGAVTENNVIMSGGEIVYKNSIIIHSIDVSGKLFGGFAEEGNVEKNTVEISGGTVHSWLMGGYSLTGAAKDNSVTVSGGTVNDNVYGGYSPDDATGNAVTVSGGTVKGDVYGGRSLNAGAGTISGAAKNNTVTIAGGTVNSSVYGGFSKDGDATGNVVNLTGATHGQDGAKLYGYNDGAASHSGNELHIGGAKTYDKNGGAVITKGSWQGMDSSGTHTNKVDTVANFDSIALHNVVWGNVPALWAKNMDNIGGLDVTGLEFYTDPDDSTVHDYALKDHMVLVRSSMSGLTGLNISYLDEGSVKTEPLTNQGINYGSAAHNSEKNGVTVGGKEVKRIYLADNNKSVDFLYCVDGEKITLGNVEFVKDGTARSLDGGFDVKNAGIDADNLQMTAESMKSVNAGDSMTVVDAEGAIKAKGATATMKAFADKTYDVAFSDGVTARLNLSGTHTDTLSQNAARTKLTYTVGEKKVSNAALKGELAWQDGATHYANTSYNFNADAKTDLGGLTFATVTTDPTGQSMTLIGGKAAGTVENAPASFGVSLDKANVTLDATAAGSAAVANGDVTYSVTGVTLDKVTVNQITDAADSVPDTWTVAKDATGKAALTIDTENMTLPTGSANKEHAILTISNDSFTGATVTGQYAYASHSPFTKANGGVSIAGEKEGGVKLSGDSKSVVYHVVQDHVKDVTLGSVTFAKDATLLTVGDEYEFTKVNTVNVQNFAVNYAAPENVAVRDSMTLLQANNTLQANALLQKMAADVKTKTHSYQFAPADGVTVAARIIGSLGTTPKGDGFTYTVNSNQADRLTFGSVDWKDSGALFKRPAAVTFAGADVDTSEIHFRNVQEMQANKQMTLVSDFGGNPGSITGTTYKIGTTLEGEGAASMADGDLVFTTKTEAKGRAQDQTHNTVMGMMAGLAALAGGTEQLSQAMDSFGGTTGSGSTDSGQGSGGQEEAESGGMIIASIDGNKMRQETGSHVTSNTWNGVLGIGGKRAVKSGTWQYAAFAEHGRANFTLHSDAGRGDGTSKYTGGGLLAKWQSRHDVYVEGSIRAGRMHDTASDLLYDAATGQSYGYDVHANYIGGHVGLGKVFRYNNGRSLDVYGKYFHMKRDGVSFEAEGHYDLDSVTSSVLRVGARYGATDKKWNWYGGLAYEYEFDGKATGRADGAEIRAASIKGGSVRGELGLRMEATKTSPWKADIRLTGYAGKRRGIGGNVSVAYTF